MKSTKKKLTRPYSHIRDCFSDGDGRWLPDDTPIVFATADGRWATILSVYWDDEKKTVIVDIGDEQGE